MFEGDTLALPIGYNSNSVIAGTLTLASQSFTTLGLIDGVYESYLPSEDFVRMVISTASVLEPGTLALLGIGLLGMELARRKRV